MNSYSVKKLKLKEYYGTQRPSFAGGPGAGSNFYSGKDLGAHNKGSLGTRGADSNFSRIVMQRLAPEYIQEEIEEIEEIDEDVEVENSRYSLKEILSLLERVEILDLDGNSLGWYGDDGNSEPPDPPNSDSRPFRNPDDPERPDYGSSTSNAIALTKSEESWKEIGLDLVFDARAGANIAEALLIVFKKKTPMIGELQALYEIYKKIKLIKKNADILIDMDKKFNKMLKETNIREMLASKDLYIKRFTSGIKKIETLQKEIYEGIGEVVENFIEVFPWEVLSAGGGALVTAPGGATAALGAAGGFLAGKFAEGVIASAIGELIEEFIQEFVESQEVDESEAFMSWLSAKSEPNTTSLKFFIFITSVFSNVLNVLSYVPIVGQAFDFSKACTRIINALLKGARMQNTLVQKIRLIENPDQIPREELEQSDDLQGMRTSAADAISGLFFRPAGSGSSNPLTRNLFETSLENKSLLYLIEEKDSELEEKEEDVNEMSAGGVPGVAVPLGRNPDGSKTTKRQIEKQYNYFNKTYGRR